MTETMDILKAKTEAVQALVTSLTSQVDTGNLDTAQGTLGFALTWLEGMKAMLPAGDATAPLIGRVFTAGDPEPTGITKVYDRDSDAWYRGGDGGWATHPSYTNGDSWAWVMDHYGPLTAGE